MENRFRLLLTTDSFDTGFAAHRGWKTAPRFQMPDSSMPSKAKSCSMRPPRDGERVRVLYDGDGEWFDGAVQVDASAPPGTFAGGRRGAHNYTVAPNQ